MNLTQGLSNAAAINNLSILHPPFLLGLITGLLAFIPNIGAIVSGVLMAALVLRARGRTPAATTARLQKIILVSSVVDDGAQR